MKQSNGVISHKVSEIFGRLVAVDVVTDNRIYWIINIYAPNSNHDRVEFFTQLPEHFNSKYVLLGDFNSVTAKEDHKSQNLDATSVQLSNMLLGNGFEEINGSHRYMYTYHHPSISDRKSRLDHIYISFSHLTLHGYAAHISFSDHHLVGMFQLKSEDSGLKSWKFNADLLLSEAFCSQVWLNCDNFDKKNSICNWKSFKIKIQALSQQHTQFLQQYSLCSSS